MRFVFRACARRYNPTCGGRHLSKVTPATACGCRGIYGIRRIHAICGRCGIRTGFVEFIGFAGFVESASSPERLFSAASSRATFLKTSLRRRHVRVRLLAPLPKPVTVERWNPANVAGMWYLDLIVSGNVEGIPSRRSRSNRLSLWLVPHRQTRSNTGIMSYPHSAVSHFSLISCGLR